LTNGRTLGGIPKPDLFGLEIQPAAQWKALQELSRVLRYRLQLSHRVIFITAWPWHWVLFTLFVINRLLRMPYWPRLGSAA